MSRSTPISALVLVAALACPVRAQDRSRDEKAPNVPAQSMPAAGMCRVWLKDVPAAQQPAPTECAVAIRNRPPNAVVLFGKDLPARDPRGMTASWASRPGPAMSRRGSVAAQAAPSLRLATPEPSAAPAGTPQRTTAKPEKPQ